MEPYASLYPDSAARLPVTERLVQQVLLMPTGTSVSAHDISAIGEIIKFAVSHGAEINRRCAKSTSAEETVSRKDAKAQRNP
jgi:hypothetical protein